MMIKQEMFGPIQTELTEILLLRPMLWYLGGALMSKLKKYKTTRRSIAKLMPGKKTKLLLFMTMSPQVEVMIKTKGG